MKFAQKSDACMVLKISAVEVVTFSNQIELSAIKESVTQTIYKTDRVILTNSRGFLVPGHFGILWGLSTGSCFTDTLSSVYKW